jgi:colanic acid/amylovoran biosynthesis glycosyltransferase
LTLIGEPADHLLYETVFNFIDTHKLADSVRVLKFIENQGFDAFLSGFDVLIQPSVFAADGDCEGGAPVVLLDAQLAGLPVIASTHCDIPDLVEQSKTGLLCPERDVDALLVAICRFYEMPTEEYAAFSLAAQHYVRTSFDVRESRRRLMGLYRELALGIP